MSATSRIEPPQASDLWAYDPDPATWPGSQEFKDMMRESNYLLIHFNRDGTQWACVYRLMFHYAIFGGLVDDLWSFNHRFCYSTDYFVAAAALQEWHSRDFDGEPMGWQRHPRTGRRRENGDPERETIAP